MQPDWGLIALCNLMYCSSVTIQFWGVFLLITTFYYIIDARIRGQDFID